MSSTLRKLALASTLAILTIPAVALAGRGGGARFNGGTGYGGSPSGGGSGARFSGGTGYGGSPSGGGSGARFSGGTGYGGSPSGAGGGARFGGGTGYGGSPSGAGGGYRNPYSGTSNAGAAAAGADYANHNNQNLNHPAAAGAAAGAGYANHNQYDQYHPGMGYGNYGNYGYAGGMGGYGYGRFGYGGYGGYGYGSGVGAWGMGSPMYGWGYSNYNNAYYGLPQMGSGQIAAPTQARIADRNDLSQSTSGAGSGQPAGPTPARIADRYDYSQPISTTAAPPAAPVASRATSGFDQAVAAFKQGNYVLARQLGEQALGQMPNDPNIHQFQALGLFAQGQYEQAAAPLYAVLTIGPGWNWTTLISMYVDADTYTQQVRALEAYIKANLQSAAAHFVLGYHYLTQGHNDAAAKQFEKAAGLQPSDKLSAQLAAQLQPPASQQPSSEGAAPTTATTAAEPPSQAKLTGRWAATPAKDARVALAITDDGNFNWAVTSPGKPAKTITGKSTYANGVLTLAGQDAQLGALAGQVAWQDDNHMTFRVLGAPQDDPGLKFER
jgi:tetratricopeptide (TPR) repeat protein